MMRIFSASKAARLACVLSLCVIGIYPLVAVAQNQRAPSATRPPGDRMAVIDIKYILEHHTRFRAEMEQVKAHFEAAREQLKAEGEAISKQKKLLYDLEPGSRDYEILDEKVSRAEADLALKANKLKKDIRLRESKILWRVYTDIRLATQQYCQQNGIGLVVQFNGEEPDAKAGTNPQTVVGMMSRPIVYNSRHLDITGWILKALNDKPVANLSERQGVRPK